MKKALVVYTSNKPTNPTKFTTRYVPNAHNLTVFLKKYLKVSGVEFGVLPDVCVFARGEFDIYELCKIRTLLDINEIPYVVSEIG